MSVDYASLVRKLGEKGMSPADIADVIEAMQGPVPAYGMEATTMNERMLRDLEKVRQRRERDRDRKRAAISAEIPRNSVESAETPETKVSPTPPSKTQPPSPPYNPPPPHSAEPIAELVEQIWSLQPRRYRRATRPDVQTALEPQLRKAPFAEILAACRAYYRLPESVKDDGAFAMGAAKLLKAGRWRDFLPKPEPPAKPADAAVQASRIQHLRDTGEWRPSWGPRPDEIAA